MFSRTPKVPTATTQPDGNRLHDLVELYAFNGGAGMTPADLAELMEYKRKLDIKIGRSRIEDPYNQDTPF